MKHWINLVLLLIFALVHCSHGSRQYRLSGARLATTLEFPFVAELNCHCRWWHVVIIHEYFVLTVASHLYTIRNVEPVPKKLCRMRLGSENNVPEGKKYALQRIIVHPDFKKKPGDISDLALLKLKTPIQFTDRVKPVPLGDVNPSKGEKGWVISYGKTVPTKEVKYNNLRAMELSVHCKKSWRKKGVVICTKPEGPKAVCRGDAGAPFVVNGKLVGIAFKMLGNCTEKTIVGFVSVPNYKAWIEKSMKENLPGKINNL